MEPRLGRELRRLGKFGRTKDDVVRHVVRLPDVVVLNKLTINDFYCKRANVGLCFGPTLINKQKFVSGLNILCIISMNLGNPGETFSIGRIGRPYLIHPATLDLINLAPFAAHYDGVGRALPRPHFSMYIREIKDLCRRDF